MVKVDYILDTNILISIYRSKRKTDEFIKTLPARNIYISIVSYIEFLGGEKLKRKNDARKFLSDFTVLSVDEEVNATLAVMCMKEQIGKNKAADLMIAATAKTYKLTLITNNSDDFDFSGLKKIEFSTGLFS